MTSSPLGCDLFWRIDPMPVPPTTDTQSMAFWRWASALVLEMRQ